MAKKDELLKVLDMPEAERWEWLVKNNIGGLAVGEVAHEADLAFRLRDEFKSVLQHADWEIGRFHVFAHCNNKTYSWTEERCELVDSWFMEWSKPIHWIIAALIAKGKGKVK